MRIYLVRHGIAVDRSDPKCPADAHRPLTERGAKRARQMARGLAVLGVKPGAVLSSSYLRAAQTAEIVCREIGFPAKKLLVTKSLLPMARTESLLAELAAIKVRAIMCFGHGPQLDTLLVTLLGCPAPITELKKAGAACLEMESLSPTAKGRLAWLFTPKALRLLGRHAGRAERKRRAG